MAIYPSHSRVTDGKVNPLNKKYTSPYLKANFGRDVKGLMLARHENDFS